MMQKSHEVISQPAVGYADTVTVVWQASVGAGEAVMVEVSAWAVTALAALLQLKGMLRGYAWAPPTAFEHRST